MRRAPELAHESGELFINNLWLLGMDGRCVQACDHGESTHTLVDGAASMTIRGSPKWTAQFKNKSHEDRREK